MLVVAADRGTHHDVIGAPRPFLQRSAGRGCRLEVGVLTDHPPAGKGGIGLRLHGGEVPSSHQVQGGSLVECEDVGLHVVIYSFQQLCGEIGHNQLAAVSAEEGHVIGRRGSFRAGGAKEGFAQLRGRLGIALDPLAFPVTVCKLSALSLGVNNAHHPCARTEETRGHVAMRRGLGHHAMEPPNVHSQFFKSRRKDVGGVDNGTPVFRVVFRIPARRSSEKVAAFPNDDSATVGAHWIVGADVGAVRLVPGPDLPSPFPGRRRGERQSLPGRPIRRAVESVVAAHGEPVPDARGETGHRPGGLSPADNIGEAYLLPPFTVRLTNRSPVVLVSHPRNAVIRGARRRVPGKVGLAKLASVDRAYAGGRGQRGLCPGDVVHPADDHEADGHGHADQGKQNTLHHFICS